jgi:hypothetical protein
LLGQSALFGRKDESMSLLKWALIFLVVSLVAALRTQSPTLSSKFPLNILGPWADLLNGLCQFLFRHAKLS